MKITNYISLTLVALASITTQADAALILPTAAQAPNGYRLFFITADTITGTSNNINIYNAFVNAEAEQATSLFKGSDVGKWSAIGSTATFNALQNTGISTSDSVPIYEIVSGSTTTLTQLVTAGANLWTANTQPLLTAPDVTQTGTANSNSVWTGTDPDGTADSQSLGNTNFSNAEIGQSTLVDGRWVTVSSNTQTLSFPTYAVSGVILAPEPASAVLLLGSGAMLLLRRRRVAV